RRRRRAAPLCHDHRPLDPVDPRPGRVEQPHPDVEEGHLMHLPTPPPPPSSTRPAPARLLRRLAPLACARALSAPTACSKHQDKGTAAAAATPAAIGASECRACGTEAREQPAPRGQAVS